MSGGLSGQRGSVGLDAPESWAFQTAGGIPYRLYEGYPKGSFDEEEAEVEEQYIIRSSDLVAFVKESLSDYDIGPGVDWRYRSARNCPMFYTDKTGDGATRFINMISKRVQFEPFPPGRPADPEGRKANGADGFALDADTYADFLLVTITYGPGKCNTYQENLPQNKADILDVSSSAGGEFIIFPITGKDQLEKRDGTKTNNQLPDLPATKSIPSIEWTIKYGRVFADRLFNRQLDDPEGLSAFEMMREHLGTINDSPVVLINNAIEETVLFTGFSLRPKWSWREDKKIYEVELKFSEKNISDIYLNDADEFETEYIGWNHVYNPRAGEWQKLKSPDGSYIYKTSDLNRLIGG